MDDELKPEEDIEAILPDEEEEVLDDPLGIVKPKGAIVDPLDDENTIPLSELEDEELDEEDSFNDENPM